MSKEIESLDVRKNCHGCPNLKHNKMRSMIIAYCGENDLVIPHLSEISDDDDCWELTYLRVPEFCPLPDREVVKRVKPCPKKDWKRDRIPRKILIG